MMGRMLQSTPFVQVNGGPGAGKTGVVTSVVSRLAERCRQEGNEREKTLLLYPCYMPLREAVGLLEEDEILSILYLRDGPLSHGEYGIAKWAERMDMLSNPICPFISFVYQLGVDRVFSVLQAYKTADDAYRLNGTDENLSLLQTSRVALRRLVLKSAIADVILMEFADYVRYRSTDGPVFTHVIVDNVEAVGVEEVLLLASCNRHARIRYFRSDLFSCLASYSANW
ncbi:hypothetical protein PENTCL1PPCAC_14052 [Pristionchus entomophagus]|uniref:Uncharacterized protein n=1 Tax=Pristionchus entomophagus TaxID=358040 RepID=A0AAV5TC19_9BILA|nr:hypothetical protein PENTCL1PPCAC_14052 [Pristionchus entomophagus]